MSHDPDILTFRRAHIDRLIYRQAVNVGLIESSSYRRLAASFLCDFLLSGREIRGQVEEIAAVSTLI